MAATRGSAGTWLWLVSFGSGLAWVSERQQREATQRELAFARDRNAQMEIAIAGHQQRERGYQQQIEALKRENVRLEKQLRASDPNPSAA